MYWLLSHFQEMMCMGGLVESKLIMCVFLRLDWMKLLCF